MIQQNAVALSYITNEINNKYENLPKDGKDNLIFVCDKFVQSQISFEEARSTFLSVNGDISFLVKLQRILTIQNEPIPSSDSYGNFSQRRLARNYNGSRKKSIPWTEIEDLRLIAAIFRYGAKDWRQIAEFVGNDRSSSQCNQRWCRAIDPNIRHTPWTPDEDQKLLRAVDVLGNKNWCQVAKIIDQRTDLQCRYRYQQLVKSGTQKVQQPIPFLQSAKQQQLPVINPLQMSNTPSTNDPKESVQAAKPPENTNQNSTNSSSRQTLYSFPLLGLSNTDNHAVDSDDALVTPPTLQEISTRRRNSITIAPFVLPSSVKPAALIKHEPLPYYLDGSMTPVSKLSSPMLHRVPPRIIQRNPTE